MASLYKYRNTYHIAYIYNGQRKTINTQIEASKDNLSKARKIKREIENNIESVYKKSGRTFNNLINQDNNITLSEAVEKCRVERIEGKSSSHLRNYRLALNYLFNIVSPSTPIGDITSSHIIKYIKLTESKLSNASVHSYIRYIKLLFNYLVDEDYIYKTPIKKKLIPKRERKSIVIFDKSELEDILSVAKERDKKFYNSLMLLLLTGLRPIDLVNLKINNFDFNRKLISIKISKTNKEIKFPLYSELETFISSNMQEEFQKDSEDFLLKGFNVEIIGKRFRRIKKQLKITKKLTVTLKTFRKTFATRIAEKGLSIQEVAYLLGHDSVKTTEKYYTDVITESLRKKINNLNGY